MSENRRIQIRNDTAANFNNVAPVLAQGELALERNTRNVKIGDGTTAYPDLPVAIPGSGIVSVGANQTITGVKTFDADVIVTQNRRIRLTNAFELTNNGAASIVRDTGEGGLVLETNGPDITLQTESGELMAVFDKNGPVTLYHNNTVRAATTANGLTVTGVLRATTAAGDWIANLGEVNAGTVTDKLVTPARLEDSRPRPRWAGPVTATGTGFNLVGIPSWANIVDVTFSGLSFAGNDDLLVRLGTADDIVSTGYFSQYNNGAVTNQTGFVIRAGLASRDLYGSLTLTRMGKDIHRWAASHSTIAASDGAASAGTGICGLLADALTRVRFVGTLGGAFDGGTVSMIFRQ